VTPPTLPDASRARAWFLGGVLALSGLALAILSAGAISLLAQGHTARGSALLALVVLARLASSVGSDWWVTRAAARVRAHYRHVVPRLIERPRPDDRASADIALAIEDVSSLPALDVLSASARTAALALVILLVAAGPLSLAIVIALLAIAVPLYVRAGRRSQRVDTEFRLRRSLLEARQLELIKHAPDLRALGAVDFGASEIGAISDSEHAIVERAVRITLSSSLVTEFLAGVSVGLVAMVVGFALLHGHISLLRALVAVLVTAELFVHVRRYGVAFHRRENAQNALATLRARGAPTASTAEPLLEAHALRTIASDDTLDLRVLAGEHILVTGPSGCGKTTLLRTLLDWTAPREGTVERADARIAHVSAESPLLSRSLWDNVVTGVNHDPREVRALLDALGLTSTRFTDLDVILEPDGRGLSSGERVRLVLARGLLARAQLLILDDVAGVLDEENRQRVRRVLARDTHAAIIEATVDTPLLEHATRTIRL
jgi:ATP-binding cassette, subfamily C, bacterial CydCD